MAGMSHESLNQDILLRLVSESLVMIYGSGERYESRAVPGAYMGLSFEPVADLNYLMVTSDTPDAVAVFESYVAQCDAADLPFCSIVSPGVLATLVPICDRLGLVHSSGGERGGSRGLGRGRRQCVRHAQRTGDARLPPAAV